MSVESAYAAPAELLRHAFGRFATGVTVITTVGPDGEPAGTTATAVTSLSLEPALLLVCLTADSATLHAILGHGAFAVNVLADGQQALSANFARRGDAAGWRDVAYDRWPSGNPRLEGALAALDCVVERVLAGGDHEIVVGRVRDGATDPRERAPLLHWRGRYVRLERA